MAGPEPERAVMALWFARLLVIAAGAVVLIIETLAARLVAPYVGLTLESHTAAIGVALLGIAAGAMLGGRMADRAPARAVIAVGLGAGGALTFLIRPIVFAIGPGLPPGASSAVIGVGLSTLAPVIALSMVPPAVVKLQLADLRESGRVVGSLSAYGTIGALAGTFLTGFVFVATLPTGAILTVAGAVCVALATAVVVTYRGRIAAAAAIIAVGVPLLVVKSPCDVETRYYCARIETDPANPGGRFLYLDDLPHSYVDLNESSHVRFWYIARFTEIIDTLFPAGRALDAVLLGGGAFTMPRWLAATRPGSRSTVLEIDPAVVSLGRARLGVGSIPALRVVIGDARVSLKDLPERSAAVIVADAFGSRSVPWHLATHEFMTENARVLQDDGIMVLNVIDNRPLAFLRAEIATVASVFADVALIARPGSLDRGGGNYIIAAARSPDRLDAIRSLDGGPVVLRGAALDEFVGGARVLTDDFAPVEQLLTPY